MLIHGPQFLVRCYFPGGFIDLQNALKLNKKNFVYLAGHVTNLTFIYELPFGYSMPNAHEVIYHNSHYIYSRMIIISLASHALAACEAIQSHHTKHTSHINMYILSPSVYCCCHSIPIFNIIELKYTVSPNIAS